MSILVVLEQRGGLKAAAREAAWTARRMADQAGVACYGLFIGRELGDQANMLAGLGLDKVFAYEGEGLHRYLNETYVPIVCELADELGAQAIIGSATALGKSLFAAAAARLDCELLQDCVELEWKGGIAARRPMYTNRIMAHQTITEPRGMATLRPNVVEVPEGDGALPEIERRTPGEAAVRTVFREAVEAEGDKLDLTEAKLIVSGGRGIKGPEHWPLLQELCDTMGATLGASRATVVSGWIDASYQVGATGKVVNPDLYLACGISGAFQHQAGMRNSRIVAAINTNPDANIFKICDYGIVGDLFEIVPLLTQEIRKLKAEG